MIIQVKKKAQEVSFVLLKIAGYIRHKELAARIESISYQLIESLYSNDLGTAMAKVDAAIGLSSLASNIGEMNQGNTAIVLRELENLKNGIIQCQESKDVIEMPSVEGLFSKMSISAPAKVIRPQSIPSQKSQVVVSNVQVKPAILNQSIQESSGAAIIRQDTILATIKLANGAKLQLKDLIAAFPDISERTLRYDLVKLCQIGKLRREGSGGPSNYYVFVGQGAGVPQSTSSDAGVMNNQPTSL